MFIKHNFRKAVSSSPLKKAFSLWAGSIFFFFNCIVLLGFLLWEIQTSSVGNACIDSRAVQPRVHSGWFSVSIIHWTLTWITWPLICACDVFAYESTGTLVDSFVQRMVALVIYTTLSDSRVFSAKEPKSSGSGSKMSSFLPSLNPRTWGRMGGSSDRHAQAKVGLVCLGFLHDGFLFWSCLFFPSSPSPTPQHCCH